MTGTAPLKILLGPPGHGTGMTYGTTKEGKHAAQGLRPRIEVSVSNLVGPDGCG